MRKQLKRQWKKLAKRSTAYFLVFAMVVSVFSVNMNIIPLGSHQFPASEPPGNFFLESHLRHKI